MQRNNENILFPVVAFYLNFVRIIWCSKIYFEKRSVFLFKKSIPHLSINLSIYLSIYANMCIILFASINHKHSIIHLSVFINVSLLLSTSPIKESIYRRCPWCSRYRRRKWTRRHEFKSWTRLIYSTNIYFT